ncbi:MAG TPA: hypothetical protein VFL92_02555 [Sphingomonas sp.]|nr:hypothetical protein [Sphingomonas sp.]
MPFEKGLRQACPELVEGLSPSSEERKWQTETRTGSPSQEAVSASQGQDAVRIVMAESL